MNMYAYVGNDPVNGKDPTGELKITCTVEDNKIDCKFEDDGKEDTTLTVRVISQNGNISRTTTKSNGMPKNKTETADLIRDGLKDATGITFKKLNFKRVMPLVIVGALTPRAKNKLGKLKDRANENAGDVARDRGASGSNIREKMGEWADRSLGEVAEAAANGDETAKTALKVVKDAARLGQRRF